MDEEKKIEEKVEEAKAKEKFEEAKIEAKIEEAKIEAKVEEAKAKAKVEEAKLEAKVEEARLEEKKSLSKRSSSKAYKKYGMIIVGIVLILLIGTSYAWKTYRQKVDIGSDAVKTKVAGFLKNNVPSNTKADIKSVEKEGSLYKITITVNGQDVPVYVTPDGSKLIPAQAMTDLNQKTGDDASKQQAEAPEKTAADTKTDVPTVDLFVMSYCPYGLQMERGILPAVEALGNKIKFNLKFVDYTLHGAKEVAENVNQYCIEKTQPAKLGAYLKCFWKDSKGASDACMASVGIKKAQITSCVADTNKQFGPTEKDFSLNKDENDKFGVQGSPTLVVNGTTISSGRDSASILKAICSGFKNQPKECQASLSSTSPAAGFDDQNAGSGSSDASCGN